MESIECFRQLSGIAVADDESLVKYLTNGFDLQTLLVKANGLIPFAAIFPNLAGTENVSEKFAAQSLTERKHPGAHRLTFQESTMVEIQESLAEA